MWIIPIETLEPILSDFVNVTANSSCEQALRLIRTVNATGQGRIEQALRFTHTVNETGHMRMQQFLRFNHAVNKTGYVQDENISKSSYLSRNDTVKNMVK